MPVIIAMRVMDALDRASNLTGALDEDLRARLYALIACPSQETWGNAYSIILNAQTWQTLWQAIIAVDPTFPRVGQSTTEDGRVVRAWPSIPDAEIVLRAIESAVIA